MSFPQTGIYIPHQNQITSFDQTRPPPINPAHLKGKSGHQIEALYYSIWNRHVDPQESFGLRINELGAKYVLFGCQFIFFESEEFNDKLRKYAFDISIRDITGTTIKSIKSILRATEDIWIKDSDNCTNGSVRIVHHDTMSYYLPKNQAIKLNYNNNFNQTDYVAFLIPSRHKEVIFADYNRIFDFDYIKSISNKQNSLYNTYLLLDELQIPKHYQLLVVAWLVHVFISREPIVLQLINADGIDNTHIANTFKEIIDPSNQVSIELPRKEEAIVLCGLEHYILHFTVSAKNKLKHEQQNALLQMTIQKGATINAINNRSTKVPYFVKRAIILSSQNNVIDLPRLQSHTLSIHLDHQVPLSDTVYFSHHINNVRNELLEHVIYYNTHVRHCYSAVKHKIETSFTDFNELLTIGYHLERMTKCDESIISQFTNHVELNFLSEIQDEDYQTIAIFLLKWAKENLSSTTTQSIKSWHNELNTIAHYNESTLDNVEYRKLGAAFKSIAPLVKKLGVRLAPPTGISRYSEWTIEVQDKFGIRAEVKTTTPA